MTRTARPVAAVVAASFAGLAITLATIAPALAQPSQAEQDALRANCRSDFMSKCRGVTPGGAEAFQCLKKNVASLSAGCQGAVNAINPPAAAAAPAAAAPPPAPKPAAVAPAPALAPVAVAPAPTSAPVPAPMPSAAPATVAPARPAAPKPAAVPQPVATAPPRNSGTADCGPAGCDPTKLPQRLHGELLRRAARRFGRTRLPAEEHPKAIAVLPAGGEKHRRRRGDGRSRPNRGLNRGAVRCTRDANRAATERDPAHLPRRLHAQLPRRPAGWPGGVGLPATQRRKTVAGLQDLGRRHRRHDTGSRSGRCRHDSGRSRAGRSRREARPARHPAGWPHPAQAEGTRELESDPPRLKRDGLTALWVLPGLTLQIRSTRLGAHNTAEIGQADFRRHP